MKATGVVRRIDDLGRIVIPKELKGYTKEGEEVSYNKLWNRRTCTKFNGASYISQKAAAATFTEQGKKEIQENQCYSLNMIL